jgi:Tol biopolymer transport system component
MEISPGQWDRVKELFEAALERAPDERPAFLERNVDDEVVRGEVNRLLTEQNDLGIFLSTPAFVDPRHPTDSGKRLAPDEVWSARFRIVNFIAAGGMGEVYRARDSTLARDVALKVLPPAFARDADRLARFQREAKVLGALNHPNIASIYGLEDSDGALALVLELVEGPTLAQRLRQGPIPVDEALPIARQICDALEYAHERGIVHRDLKPANMKVTPNDAVKILDFGLAKAIEGDPASVDISTSPTLSRMATHDGVLLGTAAYMSPEQATGKIVDRRTDVWAFGCVLFEMLTGKKAFPGETVTDTLAVVLKDNPDWSQLPAETPTRARVLLQRCLQKDVKQRLQAIGEARIVLEELLAGAPDPVAVRTERFASPRWHGVLPWALLGLTLAAFGWLVIYVRENPAVLRAPVYQYEIATPDPMLDIAELSPDGTHLVFRDSRMPDRLWLGRMDSLDVHPIEGTEGAFGIPFWSPDSRFIAFNANGKLKKADIEGDPPQVLCDSGPAVIGGFWSSDGRIIFGDPFRPPGLWDVPESGGVSSPLSEADHSGESRYAPVLLPDGKHFLYANSTNGVSGDIYVGSLDSSGGHESSKEVLTQAFNSVRYVPSQNDRDLGYLLYVRDGATRTLVAQPFDVRKLEMSGEPVRIAEQVYGFSASLTGMLIYGSAAAGHRQLALFDRQGKILGTVGDPGDYDGMAFSPDGKRVVVARFDFVSASENLWMIDLVRDISTRFTFESASDGDPVWSPDGSRVAFASNRGGTPDTIYQKLSNGGGNDELLFKSEHSVVPLSWSDDGRFLLFDGPTPASDQNISVLRVDTNEHPIGKPFPFAQDGVGDEGQFSPGPAGHPRWVAYSSNESGRSEIYVRPFDSSSPTGTPPSGAKWQVSAEGGISPRWNKSGKELFYMALDGTVMTVEINDAGTFRAGKPKPLFKPKGFSTPAKTEVYWDVSSDGKKFIFTVSPSAVGTAPPARLSVVLNWTTLLRK